MEALIRANRHRGEIVVDGDPAGLAEPLTGLGLEFTLFTFLLVGITMTPLEPSYSFRYSTASSQRGEPFMLRTGRVPYYLGSMATAWVMGLLWVGAMGLLLPWLKVTEAPEGWLALLIMGLRRFGRREFFRN